MIKPDGVQRGLVTPILDRFLNKVRAGQPSARIAARRRDPERRRRAAAAAAANRPSPPPPRRSCGR
jgi:hypothetical protein